MRRPYFCFVSHTSGENKQTQQGRRLNSMCESEIAVMFYSMKPCDDWKHSLFVASYLGSSSSSCKYMQDEKSVYLLSEPCQGGDFFAHMERNCSLAGFGLSEATAAFYAVMVYECPFLPLNNCCSNPSMPNCWVPVPSFHINWHVFAIA